MKRLFRFLFLTAAISLLFVFAKAAYADTNCQPIYGGGQTCVQVGKVLLNKTVKNPANNDFVDGLNINDPKYSPNAEVPFKIWVKNESDKTVDVTIKDTLPQYVNFVSGPGSFDNNTKTLTFDVKDLKTNETRTFDLTAKVLDANMLPTPNGSVCVVNQASLTTSDGQTASDNTQFCIATTVTTKGGLPVVSAPKIVTTPATGPEMLPLISLIPSGIAGFFLRRKAKK